LLSLTHTQSACTRAAKASEKQCSAVIKRWRLAFTPDCPRLGTIHLVFGRTSNTYTTLLPLCFGAASFTRPGSFAARQAPAEFQGSLRREVGRLLDVHCRPHRDLPTHRNPLSPASTAASGWIYLHPWYIQPCGDSIPYPPYPRLEPASSFRLPHSPTNTVPAGLHLLPGTSVFHVRTNSTVDCTDIETRQAERPHFAIPTVGRPMVCEFRRSSASVRRCTERGGTCR
jgi:hypothetical protein